jgi:histidinol-phosphate aminotransferase
MDEPRARGEGIGSAGRGPVPAETPAFNAPFRDSASRRHREGGDPASVSAAGGPDAGHRAAGEDARTDHRLALGAWESDDATGFGSPFRDSASRRPRESGDPASLRAAGGEREPGHPERGVVHSGSGTSGSGDHPATPPVGRRRGGSSPGSGDAEAGKQGDGPERGPDPVESALRRIKPAVRALGRYSLEPHRARIKLNQNESPYDVPDEVKARIAARLRDRPWNRYPPFVPESFISAVAESTGWPAEGVLVANGSNELIQASLAVTVGPGTAVVVPEPTFTLYRLMTGIHGGETVGVPLTDELRFDVEQIVRRARETGAGVIVLCSPNNPTGTALRREEILRIHDETDAILLLDQAYVEFGGYDAIPLLRGRPRLVVLRTFSKAMAMAGLRAGYLLADPAVTAEIAKAKLPYNVNFFTEVAAAEVLRAGTTMSALVALIIEQRDCILRRLGRLPALTVYPSEANFVLFRVDHPRLTHRDVFRYLLDEHGILIRDVSRYPMLDGCLRVNAGTAAETDEFLDAMSRILTTEES